MRFGEPVWVDTLLEAVQQRLAGQIGLSSDSIFETLASDDDHLSFPPADRFVTLTPTDFPADLPAFAGTGRHVIAFDGRLRVGCVCRFASDRELRSARELRDKTRTTLALQQKILDALSGWTPPTADGLSGYLKEPMRCERFSVRPKRIKDSPWAVLESVWQMKFVALLPSGNS